MDWIKKNKILAAIIAGFVILVLGSVMNGISIRAQAKGYFDLARGWADAYHRDIGEAKKEADARIKVLTAERDAARRKYDIAISIINAPWKPPADDQELVRRFQEHGLKARLSR